VTTAARWIGGIVLGGVLLYALLWFFVLAGKPLRIESANIDRQVVKQSLQYVESKQAALVDNMPEYQRVSALASQYEDPFIKKQLQGQLSALLDSMIADANAIPGNIPSIVTTFFASKGVAFNQVAP